MGNEMRGGRYWEEEEKRKCRINRGSGWAEKAFGEGMREGEEGRKGKNIRNFR